MSDNAQSSNSDAHSAAHSQDEALVEALACEPECLQSTQAGSEDEKDAPEDGPPMPPLPTKLLVASSQAASGTQTTDIDIYAFIPSAEEVEIPQISGDGSYADEDLFTVMLKNIPCRCSRQDFLQLLVDHGWGDSYDFFHLPSPKKPSKGFKGSLGYAFIGFPDPKMTKRFMQEMKGVRFPGRNSQKVLDVVPARLQGLQENLTQLARKKIYPTTTTLEAENFQVDVRKSGRQGGVASGSKDTQPKQDSGKAGPTCPNPVSKKGQSRKEDVSKKRSLQDAPMFTPFYPWRQMNGFGASDAMRSNCPQYWSGNGQQASDIEEFCMNLAAGVAHANWYGPPTGYMESHGRAQPSLDPSYWGQPFKSEDEHAPSDQGSLSPRLNSFEDTNSDADSCPEAALDVAFDDNGLEAARHADKEELPENLFTVMMKNIPCRCTRHEVLDLLADHGWGDSYNFFHLPAPPSTCKGWRGCLGYAFIGFPNSNLTKKFIQDMKGVGFTSRKSAKVLDIAPARYQGLEDNLAQLSGKKVNQSHRAPIYRKQASPIQEMYGTLRF